MANYVQKVIYYATRAMLGKVYYAHIMPMNKLCLSRVLAVNQRLPVFMVLRTDKWGCCFLPLGLEALLLSLSRNIYSFLY